MISVKNPFKLCVFTLLLMLTNGVVFSQVQTTITPVPGYTTVTKQPNGVYDINSTKPLNNGQVILNRFTPDFR